MPSKMYTSLSIFLCKESTSVSPLSSLPHRSLCLQISNCPQSPAGRGVFQHYGCSQHCQASCAHVCCAIVSDLLKLILYYNYLLISTSPVDFELTKGIFCHPLLTIRIQVGTKALDEWIFRRREDSSKKCHSLPRTIVISIKHCWYVH